MSENFCFLADVGFVEENKITVAVICIVNRLKTTVVDIFWGLILAIIVVLGFRKLPTVLSRKDAEGENERGYKGCG